MEKTYLDNFYSINKITLQNAIECRPITLKQRQEEIYIVKNKKKMIYI